MTVAQLKEELRGRKLKVTGNKVDLVTRLKAALVLDDQHEEGNDDDESNDESDDEQESIGTHGAEQDEARKRPRYVPTFKDVEESIDTFSGDDGKDVRTWIKEFEDLAKLCEWNTVQETIYATRLLRGSARLFVKSDGCRKTWKLMKNALKTEFALRVDSRAIHKELQRRKKRTDESYHEYCYKMTEIAARANVETKAVIQYIIDGIDDEGYRKSVLYGAKTIRELKDKFEIYVEMHGKMKSKSNENKKKPVTNVENKDAKRDAKRCYNCGDASHLSTACPSKEQGTKCFGCNKYGHIAAKCPDKAKAEVKKSCNIVQAGHGKWRKNVVVNDTTLNAVIDSGADLSLMCEKQYKQIGSPTLGSSTITFRGAGSNENTTLGDARLRICIDGEIYDIIVHIVRDGIISQDMLIGTDFLNTVDVHMIRGVGRISKITDDSKDLPEIYKVDMVQNNKDVDLSHIQNEDVKKEIESLVKEYKPAKSKETDVKMTIVVSDDTPIAQNARRLSVAEKTEVDRQIHAWLEEDIIQTSNSDYASPIVLVKKKNGETRICIDYRKLNAQTVKIRSVLPLIEDQVDFLQGAKVYSTLDLKSGYFHVPVEEAS
ncbi:PREDICTED: uncharacterized protein LOC105559615, partial [Vollenhovia emeryi]|uniref:uncharacterized protein LOC105559615 n=1 Tax=Vollenhovia emeryi TaxID=411798 RepID=UPI0005F3F17B